ncbi:MAG: 4-(cytidine 5'-diphospho)-2-C-methyl-D-erythritol kinase [Minisyncoccia bacterium]
MKRVLIQANAKINLEFKILGKLDNGYHQIKSIFQSINLSDFLLIEKSKENKITGAIICPETENIIFKAKKELEKYIKKELPAKIHLQKTIPISAGLGGGSVDAAATIFGLNLIYNLKLSKKKLVELGKKVGADIPYFFYGGTCKVEGIGEKIKTIKKNCQNILFYLGLIKGLKRK